MNEMIHDDVIKAHGVASNKHALADFFQWWLAANKKSLLITDFTLQFNHKVLIPRQQIYQYQFILIAERLHHFA